MEWQEILVQLMRAFMVLGLVVLCVGLVVFVWWVLCRDLIKRK
jgi:hypothetical protein